MMPPVIAVVIPCYKEKQHILNVIESIGDEVACIYVVDDACPEQTGNYVKEHCRDDRVRLLFHEQNLGVGGAVMTGYKAAIREQADVIVKIDGDGQMNPALISRFVKPILEHGADYTKGNRFFNIEDLHGMPLIRVLGNAGLSFFTKFSSGYWHVFDPTNGYTAIAANVASYLPFEKISRDFFFESDMLFRLNTLGAVVRDIPMKSHYADERSQLRISSSLWRFLRKNLGNCCKRIVYNYFLRNFSVASLELVLGLALLLFGGIFGITAWLHSIESGVVASSGTVIIAALPIILGAQLLLSFIAFDMQNIPDRVLHKNL